MSLHFRALAAGWMVAAALFPPKLATPQDSSSSPPRSRPRASGSARPAAGPQQRGPQTDGQRTAPAPRTAAKKRAGTAPAEGRQTIPLAVPPLPAAPAAPRAPFRLTPAQEAELDMLLKAWEQRAGKIDTLSCDFTMFEYDPVWGAKDAEGNTIPKQRTGKLYYASPDQGRYEVYDEQNKYIEKWVCDGQAMYEFDYDQKVLHEYPIPKELQGKALQDTPLPFVFSSTAAKMKQRYWMRITTPHEEEGKHIWLEAYPRYQQDAGTFQKMEIVLKFNMLPWALNQYLPDHAPQNEHRKAYAFSNVKFNDRIGWLKKFFKRPTTPLGWERIVEKPESQPSPAEEVPPARPARAKAPAQAAAPTKPNKQRK